MSDHRKIESCRVGQSKHLVTVLDIGGQALDRCILEDAVGQRDKRGPPKPAASLPEPPNLLHPRPRAHAGLGRYRVEAGPIAVVLAVHLPRVVGVGEQEQAAVRVPDEVERAGGDGEVPPAREESGQRLYLPARARDQIRAAARPALVQRYRIA